MLFGQVTDLNTEIQLRTQSGGIDSYSPLRSVILMRKGDESLTACIRDPALQNLDRLVAIDFLDRLPMEYKNYLHNMVGDDIDTDLFMVHLIPHA